MMQNIFAGAVPSKKICLNEPEFDACDECCTKIGYPDEKYKSFATEVLYIIFIQFLCFTLLAVSADDHIILLFIKFLHLI